MSTSADADAVTETSPETQLAEKKDPPSIVAAQAVGLPAPEPDLRSPKKVIFWFLGAILGLYLIAVIIPNHLPPIVIPPSTPATPPAASAPTTPAAPTVAPTRPRHHKHARAHTVHLVAPAHASRPASQVHIARADESGLVRHLAVQQVQDRHYLLTWDPVGSGYTYRVYFATNGKMREATPAQDAALGDPSYRFTLNASPTNVWMAVAPVDGNHHEGPLSKPVNLGGESSVRHLTAHHLTDQEYSLTWDSAGDGFTYRVYYANNGVMQDSETVLYKTVDGTTYRFSMNGDAKNVWMAVAPVDANQHEGPLSRPVNIGNDALQQ